MTSSGIVLLGYSGHAFVAAEIIRLMGETLAGYCEQEAKTLNPYGLPYLGTEADSTVLDRLKAHPYFIAIGDNGLRKRVYEKVRGAWGDPKTILHPTAVLSASAAIGPGAMIGARAVVNPQCSIGLGTICNTGSIVEHDCEVGDFCHIAPSATLCGSVSVGDGTFIGAGSVVRDGVTIGAHAIIGAGSVVLKDVPDGATVFGNPARMYNIPKP
jgi:sugar O-acyltransferase (sialic acid O-acetyltransferase NeuD family)